MSKLSQHETNAFEHGRIENRKYYVLSDSSFIHDIAKWKNLKSIGLVINQREIKGKIFRQYKYYILDIELKAEEFAQYTRKHWNIENGLYWILDVHFKEDLSKSKKDHIIFNLSLLRKICYNLVKLDQSFGNISLKKKLNRYSFHLDHLYHLIFWVIPTIY